MVADLKETSLNWALFLHDAIHFSTLFSVEYNVVLFVIHKAVSKLVRDR